jgi:hypothetical protein
VVSATGTTTLTSTGGVGNDTINLDTAGNNFSTVSATGGEVTLNDTNAIVLGTTSAANLTVTANGAIPQDSGSTINVSGTTTLNSSSASAITLNGTTNDFGTVNATGGDVTLNDTGAIVLGTTSAGNLTVTAGGAITQASGSSINVSGGTTTLDAGSSAITLNESTNDFGTVNASTFGAGSPSVTLSDVNAIVLGDVRSGSTLTVTANGSITQVAGSKLDLFITVLNSTGNPIELDQPTNSFFSSVTATAVGSNVTLVDADGIDLRDITAGNLTVTANGTISDTAPVNVSGTTTLNSSGNPITLDFVVNDFGTVNATATGATVTLRDANGLALGDTTAGNLTITAAGAINQATGSAIDVSGGTTTLAAGSNAITLDDSSNDFGTVNATGGDVVLKDSKAITLGTTVASNLTVTAAGAINQSAALNVSGGTTTLYSGGGTSPIELEDPANDFGTVNVTGGPVFLNDTNGIILGSSSVGDLTVNAGGITQSGAVATYSGATLSSTGAIYLTDTTNSFGSLV